MRQLEDAPAAPPTQPSAALSLRAFAGQRYGDLPLWGAVALGGVYLAALAVMAFAPGGTLLDRLRVLDGGICAQLPTHSFYPGGEQLPLCARNTGIYLGVGIGLTLLVARGHGRSARLPGGGVALILLGGVALMAVDGFNSLFLDLHLPHLYTPNNLLRLATGLLTGTAMAAYLLPVVNGVLWRRPTDEAAYPAPRSLLMVAPWLVVAFLVVASQTAVILYPVALLSTASVVATLAGINLTFALALSGRVGRFERWGQTWPLLTGVVALAVLELIGLFFVKQSLLQSIG